jgi:DNA-binding transcriptional MerR regulator
MPGTPRHGQKIEHRPCNVNIIYVHYRRSKAEPALQPLDLHHESAPEPGSRPIETCTEFADGSRFRDVSRARTPTPEITYPLRSAAQLTGLSPELLRAWERRYRAVEPLRTPGGTRRYRASDLERLRLLRAAIDAGHRIGSLARLSNEELEQLATAVEAVPRDRLASVLAALDDFDGAEAQRLLATQLSTLGSVCFAREIAMPLLVEIGERWVGKKLRVASEHLATAVLRSMLGSALQPSATSLRGPRVVFSTLGGERHELGLLMAALAAMGAGANPLYLGPEVPVEDLLHAVERCGAAALALSIVAQPESEVAAPLAALRAGLPSHVHLWIGGAGAAALPLPPGVERIEGFEQLEQRVGLLDYEKAHER